MNNDDYLALKKNILMISQSRTQIIDFVEPNFQKKKPPIIIKFWQTKSKKWKKKRNSNSQFTIQKNPTISICFAL